MNRLFILKCLLSFFILSACLCLHGENLSPNLALVRGPVNRVLAGSGDSTIAVYGADADQRDRVKALLLTHGRRDVLANARNLPASVNVYAPEKERSMFESPHEFWREFTVSRFHDYEQQSTKRLGQPLMVSRWVQGGGEISEGPYRIRVLDTPGYTRGSVSYVLDIDGRTVAFTGDLIYGDGQLLDLYSLQEAVPEANVRGYHGYAARMADLIDSLQAIHDVDPDWILPARGPLIEQPRQAIDRLIQRLRAVYRNYLSTNALHWYFKRDRMELCGRRVLGEDAEVDLMPYSVYQEMPGWVLSQATSRLILSEDGHGFLLDCGYQGVIDAVREWMDQGLVKSVEGIFVTHFHDDHSDQVQHAADVFNCPVYATPQYEDTLKNPGAYHLPAMTSNPIRDVRVMPDGATMRWRDFDLTFYDYPGQTYYHGALLARKDGEEPLFFIGDSFAPSGIDDYCLLNRNLLHEDSGYLKCFKMLRDLGESIWLVNEHILHRFRFSNAEMDYLESRYRDRIEILRGLFPWDDPNYGVDEQWAVFYPYGSEWKPEAAAKLELRITNHSPKAREFKVRIKGEGDFEIRNPRQTLKVPPRQTAAVKFEAKTPQRTGAYLITADVVSEDMEFLDWSEALIVVQ